MRADRGLVYAFIAGIPTALIVALGDWDKAETLVIVSTVYLCAAAVAHFTR